MATPLVLHLTRPYDTVDEYLNAEAWSIEARAMLLIEHPPIEPDTPIVFDVTLRDGSRPIKAEAKVTRSVEPEGEKPGGLRVRFKRYGAPTKAFIDRAVALVESGAFATNPPPPPSEPSATASALETSTEPEAIAVPVAPTLLSPGNFYPVAVAPTASADVPAGLAALRSRDASTPETPPNREYLLEKLRQRGLGDDVTSRYVRPR